MGNGRRLSGRSSGSRLWLRVTGAGLVLLVAGCTLFVGSRQHPVEAAKMAGSASLPGGIGASAEKAKPDAQSLLSRLPLIFEPNQGQADSGIQFVTRGAGYSLYLDATGAVLATPAAERSPSGGNLEAVRMTLVGANRTAAITGTDLLPGKSNYFIGNDPAKWRTGIPQFAGVRYRSVYPGIDLVFYGSQGRLEYDFKVAPGADPAQAELQFEGGTKLELNGGDLVLKGTGANVRLQAPQVYQSAAGRRERVEGRFVLRAANRVGFEIGSYDRGRELVIDPTISYSTYFGGTGSETAPSIAVNGNGFIYLAGSTTSTDLPKTANAFQSTLNGAQNIFVLEIDPTIAGAGGVAYLTYLGGSGTDASVGLAVDNGGNVFVAGSTTSANFPSVNGYVSTVGSAGMSHVFVSEITQITTALPALAYSTVLAGNGADVASGMAIDNNRDVFVTGTTTSNNSAGPSVVFPASLLPAPFQAVPAPGSAIQFFVTKVNTKTIGVASVPYSTYFGGATPTGAVALGGGIAVDSTGNVYFSGTTNFYNSQESQGGGGAQATDFPILNAYQPCLDTPPSTTLTFPISCTPPTTTPYPTDAFVAKLNPANAQTGAAQLLFSSYFGGAGSDSSSALTIDAGAASIYITGSTNSSDFVVPTGIAPFQMCLDTPVNPTPPATCTPPNSAPNDAYVARFTNPTEANGTTGTLLGLSYFSYLGGTGTDDGLALAVDTAGGALLTGSTSSTDFPVSTGAIQTHLAGARNAFFAHINTTTVSGTNTVASYATYFGGNGMDRGTSITLDPSLNIYFAGDTTSTNLQTQGALQTTLNGSNSDAFAVKLQPASDLCIRCVLPVVSPASGIVSAGSQVTITYTLTNNGPDLATNITVSGSVTAGATFTSATAGSGVCSAPTGGSVVCTIPTLQSGSTSTVAFVATPTKAGSYSATATATAANSTNTSNTATASFTATDFSISISPSSQTVVAGNAAIYSVVVTPSQTFGTNVSLSCGSLPVGSSCGFNPSTLTFNGPGAQSSTLTLTTTARPVTTISSINWRSPFYALWLVGPGMAFIGFGGSKRGRKRLTGLLAVLVLFSLAALQPACSSKKQQQTVTGTPAGSYPLTVTATSGSFTQSAGFNLTVQ